MKKNLLFIATLILSVSSSFAQEIGSVFLTMPESVIFNLEAAQKDLLISDPVDTTELFVDRGTYGEIRRKAITSDFISLETSEAATIQIKLLPLVNESKIICVVNTICSKENVCDSRIQFYTTNWLPITQGDLLPEISKDLFIKSDVDKDSQGFKNAYLALDMNPIKADLSESDTSLSLTYNIKEYLSEEDYKNIEPYLIKESIKLSWDKTSYKILK